MDKNVQSLLYNRKRRTVAFNAVESCSEIFTGFSLKYIIKIGSKSPSRVEMGAWLNRFAFKWSGTIN